MLKQTRLRARAKVCRAKANFLNHPIFLTIVNMTVLPQEIQVWYVLPALRREIARILIKSHGFTQKQVASVLGITEGAVSQYLNSKRGASVKFEADIMKEISWSAQRIAKDNSTAMEELLSLSEMDKVKTVVCKLHIAQEPSVEKTCDICFR